LYSNSKYTIMAGCGSPMPATPEHISSHMEKITQLSGAGEAIPGQ